MPDGLTVSIHEYRPGGQRLKVELDPNSGEVIGSSLQAREETRLPAPGSDSPRADEVE